jgi:hypothetical protein
MGDEFSINNSLIGKNKSDEHEKSSKGILMSNNGGEKGKADSIFRLAS